MAKKSVLRPSILKIATDPTLAVYKKPIDVLFELLEL